LSNREVAGDMTDEKPAIGCDGGLLGDCHFLAPEIRQSPLSPERPGPQEKSRARLRLVAPPPPPRPWRIEAQISVRDGRAPIGRSRRFLLTLDELLELIAHLESIEARG
jgi:hypothetical protein